MTEKSYFWNGITLGDAADAPYDAETYTTLLGMLYTSNESFVIDTTPLLSVLSVIPNANMVVDVQAGYALVKGYFFTSTAAVSFTVPANTSGFPRYDRIVVRINKNTNTGLLVLLQGTPSITPYPPALSTDLYLLDLPLARIYIPNGLAAITAEYIVDEREIWSAYSVPFSHLYYAVDNVMPNSEFMAGALTAYGTAPAMWTVAGTATCEVDTKFDQMMRGSSVKVTCPALNDGITTTVSRLTNGNTITMTVRLLIEVLEGETYIDIGGKIARIPPTNGAQEFLFRFTRGPASRNLTFSIYNPNSTQTTFILGQITLSYGGVGAAFIPKKEIVLFTKPVTPDGHADTDTAALGTLEIDLSASVAGGISPLSAGISALLTRLDVRDTASAGTDTAYGALQDIDNDANQVRVEVGRYANSTIHSAQGFVGVPFDATGVQKYQRQAQANHIGINHIGCQT